jgi:hypothetical protein
MGNIKKCLLEKQRFESDYALFDINNGELSIRENIVKTDHFVSLKNVDYAIIDGVLYISGTQLKWFYIPNTWESISYRYNNLYEITKDFVDNLEIPEESIQRDIRIGKWPFNKKREIVFDKSKNPYGQWLKYKVEYPFEYCLHPFKIREK